jgi:hypothetical protein
MAEMLPSSEIPPVTEKSDRPVWIRLPKQARNGKPAEHCPISGLPRATLIDLTVKSKRNGWKPPVRSKKIRQKGSKRGIRLIHVESLLAWIEDQPDEDTTIQETTHA